MIYYVSLVIGRHYNSRILFYLCGCHYIDLAERLIICVLREKIKKMPWLVLKENAKKKLKSKKATHT